MGNIRHPRRGSMQFWPRKRSRHSLVRIRSWVKESKTKPLGYICYKVGMAHTMAVDNRAKSLTKGETIAIPATIVDCPPMTVMGVSFYKNTHKMSSVLADKLEKYLEKRMPLPKKATKKIDEISDFDDLRLLVNSNPARAKIGVKKPHSLEIALGGSREEKLAYAKGMLGKEITIKDVFTPGVLVDIHGVTKGKGFQGTVKRFGVPIRQHKAEKTKRGIATLGSWTPKRVEFTVAQSGKMGYHLRTEFNKQILKLGEHGGEIVRKGGFHHYGEVLNSYLLIKGSVVGPARRAIVLTPAARPSQKHLAASYDVTDIVVQ